MNEKEVAKKDASHPEKKKFYIRNGILCAALSSIPMIFFVHSGNFKQIWLLYLGDAIFLFSMLAVIVFINKQRNENASAMFLIRDGILTTIIATISVCIITLATVLIDYPQTFGSNSVNALKQEPTNMVQGKTDGLMFILFAHAVLATFAAGSFVTILTAYTSKRDQTKDKAEI